MVVSEEDSYNFAYVLPKTNDSNPTQIVIPNLLQMGWVNSPGFFCAATKTAQDVADTNITNNVKEEKQKLEEIMMNFPLLDVKWLDNTDKKFCHLMEVYVDDFILLLQTKSLTVLRDKTQNLLQAIYNTFSKQELNQQSNPISVKKLEEEGVWETRKEILGWLFDGVRQSIKLKDDKRHKIIKLLQELRKSPTLTLNKLEKNSQ